jgi:hypothetical protein
MLRGSAPSVSASIPSSLKHGIWMMSLRITSIDEAD